jgi:hypothetical protein
VTQNIDIESNPIARFLFAYHGRVRRVGTRNHPRAGDSRRAGARANGKTLGRPKRVFRRDQALRLRDQGMSWRKIAAQLGVPVTTVVEACQQSVPDMP